MDIQDRKKSLTAEELRQRYNLEDISKNKKAIQVQKDSITKLDAHLEDFIDATTESLEELQDQVDGNITTWFYSGVPTLSNEPAVEWTTDEEKNRHFGDLYYDQSTGYAYRFGKQSNQYVWIKLTDSDVTEALRIANEAQDTADNKRRVFTTTPTTPYDVGDLYLYNEDLYVCSTARESGSYVSTDFEIATKYTDDSALTTFINGSYASTIQTLEGQIDGKSETYYQSTDPSSTWTTTTEKDKHVGDLWYNTTANKSYIYTKSGSTYSWQEADGVPQSVYDKIDGKAQIFSSQPTPPYYAKDLWVQGSTGDIKHCIQTRTSGSFNANDWVLSSKYTDDSSLNTFVNVTYAAAMENLTNQIDGKISTWYYNGVPTLSNLPASEWTTDDDKLKHTGDLYYDKATGYCYMFEYESSTFKWTRIEDSSIIDALAVANAAQDTADNKRRVFVVQPTPPYDIGDIWIKEDTDLYRCKIAAPEGGSYSVSHWILATNYTDDTVALEAQAALDQFKVDVQETYATSADLITTANSINGRVDETYTYITTVETNTNNQIADITNTSQNIEGNNSLYIEDAIQDNAISYSVDGATSQDGTPTPDSPVEVKTIPSIINLANIINGTYTVANEITGIVNNGEIKLNGTATATRILQTFTDSIYLEVGTYTLSINNTTAISGGNNNCIRVAKLDGTTVSNSSCGFGTLNNYTTFDITENDYYKFQIRTNSGTTYNNFIFNPQLEEGSVSHEYVPYGYWSKVKVTGKNIFDKDNANILTGTIGTENFTGGGNNRAIVITCSPNTTYTVQKRNDGDTNRFALASSETIPSSTGSVTTPLLNNIRDDNGNTLTLTTGASAKYLIVQYYRINETVLTEQQILDSIQIEQNNQATTYEPYKENQVLIDMSKENLFDSSNPNILNAYVEATKLSGSTNTRTIYIPITGGKTYTVSKIASMRFKLGTTADTPVLNAPIINYVAGDTSTSLTITASSTANYLCVFYYHASHDTLTEETIRNSIQIFESNNPTPYYELCEIGDYKDTLSIDSSGNVVVNKGIGKVVLNGSESWTYQITNGYRTDISNIKQTTSGGENSYVISNYYQTEKQQNLSNVDYGISNRANQSQIIIKNKDCADSTALKTWLSTHNTDVYYVLATPETITLPNTKIPLFEGINHVTFVDDLETDTSITYYRQTPLSDTYATQKQLNDVSTQKTQEITQVRNEVQAEITATNATINVINETIENGVSKVSGTGYTFDSDGLKIEKTGQDVKTLIDNDGLVTSYQNTEILTVRSNGIEAENMTVRKFYIQRPIRMEKTKSISDSTKSGIGFFYIGEEE